MSEAFKKALMSKKNKFDELNDKGYTRISGKSAPIDKGYEVVQGIPPQHLEPNKITVSAKSDMAKALEKSAIEVESQGLKKAFKSGDDIFGRFRSKTGGKMGALGAAATLGYQAFKGEPVMAQDVFKAGAEVINPLPFSMDEIKSETEKMDPKKKLEQLMADKELERKMREDKARPGALEFGKYLKKMK